MSLTSALSGAISTPKSIAITTVAAGSVVAAIWYLNRPVASTAKAPAPTPGSAGTASAAPDEELLKSFLGTAKLGRQFNYSASVSSTMVLAQDTLDTGDAEQVHGAVYMADEQTAGRGRRNRNWVSMPGGNIYMSFIWSVAHLPDVRQKLAKLSQLNMVCGIAVAKAARAEGVDACVKWPNDVWVGDRKLSGMILDFKDRKQSGAVVGIGINVNQDPATFDDATAKVGTTISKELGQQVPRERVLASVLNEIEKLMRVPMDRVLEEYTSCDMLAGQVVRVFHKSREVGDARDYNATVLGYHTDGTMKVSPIDRPADIIFLSGEEISVRPAAK